MDDFRTRQRRRKVLSSNITIIVLLVVIGVFSKEVWDIYTKERHARESLNHAAARYADLSERKDFLDAEITMLEDEEGVEWKLRERFGIAKPGERVIVLVDEEATTTVQEHTESFWDTVWGWFR